MSAGSTAGSATLRFSLIFLDGRRCERVGLLFQTEVLRVLQAVFGVCLNLDGVRRPPRQVVEHRYVFCRRLLHIPGPCVSVSGTKPSSALRHPLQVYSRDMECEIVTMNHASGASRRDVERCRRRLAEHQALFLQMAAVVLFPSASCKPHLVLYSHRLSFAQPPPISSSVLKWSRSSG